MADNIYNINDANKDVEVLSLTPVDFENKKEWDLPVSVSKSAQEVTSVEEDEEREVYNSCDVLAEYIQQEAEEYKGTIVKPEDVQIVYDARQNFLRNKLGRKTTLTPQIFLKIIELREMYNFPELRICAAIGLSEQNLRIWRNRGKLPKEHTNYDPYFSFFSWCYEKAGSYIEKGCLDNLKRIAVDKWEANKFLLTSLHRDRYGERTEVESGINNGHNGNVNLSVTLNLGDLKMVNNDLESFVENPIEIDNE